MSFEPEFLGGFPLPVSVLGEIMKVISVMWGLVVGTVAAAKKMAKNVIEFVSAPVLAGGVMLGAGAAHAVDFTLDTTSIVAVIATAVTTISTLGLAVLSLVVVVKLFKWVQRVL